ncbi:MAG: hypothetical protein R3B93_07520 [Bacteroidia bacterium]
MIFTAPKQIITVNKTQELNQVKGWMLYFHPDLIRNTTLGSKIDSYNFFNYEVHEALHLSEQEQNTLNQIIVLIKNEIKERIDNHSQQVLVSNIELLLNYSKRFYERQFNTRSASNTDIVSKVESLLKNYYSENELIEKGQPTIQYLAGQCHLSPSYLSDLLAKETESVRLKTTSMTLSLTSQTFTINIDSISGIAYTLEQLPPLFWKVDKQKTGKTPRGISTAPLKRGSKRMCLALTCPIAQTPSLQRGFRKASFLWKPTLQPPGGCVKGQSVCGSVLHASRKGKQQPFCLLRQYAMRRYRAKYLFTTCRSAEGGTKGGKHIQVNTFLLFLQFVFNLPLFVLI